MEVAPIPRLAVPTGTAAAAVILRDPTGDPEIDARRFACIARLADAEFRGAFEELIVAGVYTVLTGRVLVLRVSGGGIRCFAAVVSIRDRDVSNATRPQPRAGLSVHAGSIAVPTSESDEAAPSLRALLEAETKQRPVFHGMTADGTTYSGFDAQATTEILSAIARALPTTCAPAPVALVFAGDPVDIPVGLAVGLHTATV